MNCIKLISQCFVDDVISFYKDVPNHIKPQLFTGHLVGITHHDDCQVWLLGFKEKPFEDAWANSGGGNWIKPTTLSRFISQYTYFWYMREDEEVEVLLPENEAEPTTERMISEAVIEGPTKETPTVSLKENDSETTVPCMTFQCAICKREHITIERDDRECFLIPSTITTSAAKTDLPEIGKTKGQYYFHCKEYCP